MNFPREPGEIGLIESVSLKNFMCHDNLKLNFGPHVNYILGKNGSGKSAVLAAIIVALGGKINTTGRGLNIKSIIQKGKQTSTVAVSLKNTGSDAFHPEQYGPLIVIERILSIDGVSSYNLKDFEGRVISTKKVDLNAILNAFNIQVWNPVAVLTQENIRNFLNSKSNRDKYTLFFKATQLEMLEELYKKAKMQRAAAQNILEIKQRALPHLKFEVKGLEKKLKDFESLEKLKEQLSELCYSEFIWAAAIEKKEHVKEISKMIEKLEGDAEEEMKELQRIEEKYEEVVTKENATKDKITKVQLEIEDIKEWQKMVCNKKSECRQKLRENWCSNQNLIRDIALQEKQVANVVNSIENVLRHTQDNSERKQLEREEKISKHQKKVDKLFRNVIFLKVKLEQQKDRLLNLRNKCGKNTDDSLALRYRVAVAEQELNMIRQCQSNSILAYGQEMPELLERIKEAATKKKFHCVPKGPVGMHVKVKDPQWTLAIECCLGSNLLRSFLCDNEDDEEVLYDIMKTVFHGRMPQVITGKFGNKVYDVSSSQVKSSNFCSVLDVLDVDDPVIMNCIIDERGIENILLIPSNDEARNVMMYDPPEKCSEALTLKANAIYPSPNFCFYANKKKTVTLISTLENLSQNMSEKTRELQVLKATSQRCQSDGTCLEQQLSAQEYVVGQTEQEVSRLQALILKEKADMREMDVAEESSIVIHSLEDELKTATLSLKNLQNSKNEKESVLKSCAEELKNVEAEEANWREAREEKNAELNALSRLAILESSRSSNSIMEEKNSHEKTFQQISQQLATLKREYEKQVCVANEKVAAAEEMYPRAVTEGKPESIAGLISQTKEMIERGTESQGNIEETMELYHTKRLEYHEARREVSYMKTFLSRCQGMVRQRVQAFNTIRANVGLQVKSLFATTLYAHGYSGKLKFNHANRSLEIFAKPNTSAAMQGTKSLSGGEKSFITVALLLALWDVVKMPFRIVDEFDAYMDQVNRKHSMDLMLSTALEHSSSQFIFLSPLELVKIAPSEKIKIIHMPNPERDEELHGEEEPMDID